jgi:hypothetical protein
MSDTMFESFVSILDDAMSLIVEGLGNPDSSEAQLRVSYESLSLSEGRLKTLPKTAHALRELAYSLYLQKKAQATARPSA